MFGLVVILNKKISFLHDELLQLRADLCRPYFMPTLIDDHRRPVSVQARKSPSKKSATTTAAVKESAITMKEALPDVFDKDAAMRELELGRATMAEVPGLSTTATSITMEDTFDLYDHTLLIPVERDDFVTDMFGAPVSPLFRGLFTVI